MSERRVFFFGAGASKAEGGLLTSELLFESLTHREVPEEFTSIVKRFLKELFGIENISRLGSAKEIPGFEELLSLVDVAILKQEEFSASWNTDNLHQLREALVYCMAKILRIKLSLAAGEEAHQKYHQQFIKNILDDDENAISSNSFLSLNYDILLDNPILERYPKIDIDYGVSFRNMFEPRPKLGVKLLKLHGSLNWAFCPVCNSISLSREGKISDKIIAERIACSDGAVQRPLLIPPTWLKVYDNAHLVRIWLESERVLRKARSVFFIGYSLPESDFHVRYLLKKSLFRSNNSPRVVVITRPGNKEGSDLHLRYKRFFGEVEYYDIGFGKFSGDVRKYL